LGHLAQTGSPAIAGFAAWAAENPQEIAFHSLRPLAGRAGVNVNTVYRVARALGFDGFDACRAAFQAALRAAPGLYGQRAAQLRAAAPDGLPAAIEAAAHRNIEALFAPEMLARIDSAAAHLLAARQVQCVGVRSCFSLAHYLSYTGRMGFGSFAPLPAEPGAVIDALSDLGPADVVVAFTFARYSAEVVAAHGLARERGAKLIAVTDSYASPIAQDAAVVFALPMEGPQTLPSLGAAFALIEILVATMIARSETAGDRIRTFEERLQRHGGYVG
jgi:DNA-binding MurR/RpiR family transcriptional regulator